MKYYINETICKTFDAEYKAKYDVLQIISEMGYKPITINNDSNPSSVFLKIIKQIKINNELLRKTKKLKKGDILFFQYPLVYSNRSIFYFFTFLYLRFRGVILFSLIHDINSLRFVDKRKIKISKVITQIYEKSMFYSFNSIIIHNNSMKKYLEKKYNNIENKLFSLEIFDYLSEFDNTKNFYDKNSIAFAGNLSINKSRFIYTLPDRVKINLFGPNFDPSINDSLNNNYKGVFSNDKLLNEVCSNGYGLVWDGDSISLCTGQRGEYLKYNNPHKASMYLAAGIPIIVWDESALSIFVKKNNCGIVINSLEKIDEIINNISETYYCEMRKKAKEIGEDIKKGNYLRKAINQIEREYQ